MRIRPRKPRPVSAEAQEIADELQKRLAAGEVKRAGERREFGATREVRGPIEKLRSGHPAVTPGSHGTVVMNGDGTVTYTPNTGFSGNDSYAYTVMRGRVIEKATVYVTVTAAADKADDGATSVEDQAITTGALANNSFEGTPAVTAVTQGTHGSVVSNVNGTVTYTPNADFSGSDSYTYTVIRGRVAETVTVNVTVTAVADNADDSARDDVSHPGWVALKALQNAPPGAPQTAPRGEFVTLARELVARVSVPELRTRCSVRCRAPLLPRPFGFRSARSLSQAPNE